MPGADRGPGIEQQEARIAWVLDLPALLTILLVTLFPLLWTFWESLHLHDLRMPWLGQPFVGLDNYVEALRDPRFWGSLGHTAFFALASVSLELVIGLWLALALNRAFRGRGLVRAAVLIPWAIPTVVSALLWRFMFEGRAGIANALFREPPVWFIVPAVTLLAGAFATGIGSPVSRDVSTCDEPPTTTPSHGTISPGRTSR